MTNAAISTELDLCFLWFSYKLQKQPAENDAERQVKRNYRDKSI